MFAWQGWGVVRPWASGFTVWSYRTDDAVNEVMAEGYFDPLQVLGGIQTDDWVVGFAALERPIELIILEIRPRLVVGQLHEWVDKACRTMPLMPHAH